MKRLRGKAAGQGLKIGIVVSRFNPKITDRLYDGALKGLADCGVAGRSITAVEVPGAFELGPAAGRLAEAKKPDAIVCLGAVIKGKTEHFTYVCKAAQEGVTAVSLQTGLPVTFGVLTTENSAQAMERSGGAKGNKGYDAAVEAVELANTYRLLG